MPANPAQPLFPNNELPDTLYWRIENSLSDCYPLPDFERHLALPLFDEDIMAVPVSKGGLSLIPDEYYPLWAARFAQQQSAAILGQRVGLSDLWRFWLLLENAHDHIHTILERASLDPGSVVTGQYLSLSLFHAGVESLMRDTKNQLMKYYPMRTG